MNIETHPNWRKGQTIFNFLEWLRVSKGYQGEQSVRMADPFHISDKKMDELYKEYMDLYK